MKIQLKTALLRHFRSDIAALQSEKLVFASCQHPFIVSMEYSFQTDGLVFIVLDLVTGGDLHQARKGEKWKEKKIDVFYKTYQLFYFRSMSLPPPSRGQNAFLRCGNRPCG